MIRTFRITNTTDGQHIGQVCEFETKIKSENKVDFISKPLRTTMFNGLDIKLINSNYTVEARIK